MPNAEQISQIPYRKELAETLRSEPNHTFRRGLLELAKNDPEYKSAKNAEKRRKLALREISSLTSTHTEDESFQASPVIGNPLVDLKPAERELTPQEQTILWANQILDQYNSLPKQNSRERKIATNLVTQAARRLIQIPTEIDIAGSVWKSRERTSEDYTLPLVKDQ